MNKQMDLIKMYIKEQRRQEFNKSPQLSIGTLIEKLSEIPIDQKDNPPVIIFDFCRSYPTSIDSWRGIYSELALDHNQNYSSKKPMALPDFIEMLKNCDGATFTGYKGGEFTMSLETPIWVDNYGQSTRTAVVGVMNDGYHVVLLTKYMP